MPRPKGSKNRSKEEIMREREMKARLNRGRGRPRKVSTAPVVDTPAPEPVQETLPAKRKAGRPYGSKDKKQRGYTMSEKALEVRRNTLAVKDPKAPEDIEYNARLIRHIMNINAISVKADRNNLDSLKQCFVEYLQLCEQDGFSITNLSAYASLGMDYKGFCHFAEREDPAIKEFCTAVRKTCAMFRENMVSTNKLNPVIGIFWQRNFDGLRNDTEQIQAIQETDDNYSAGGSSYKDRYRNLLGE